MKGITLTKEEEQIIIIKRWWKSLDYLAKLLLATNVLDNYHIESELVDSDLIKIYNSINHN